MKFFLIFFIILGLFLSTCKTKPITPPEPYALLEPVLVFDKVEAKAPSVMTLFFSLEINNPFPFPGSAKIESWQAELNGKRAVSGFSLENPNAVFSLSAAPNSYASFPISLHMDIGALSLEGLAPEDDYTVNLLTELSFSYDSVPAERITLSCLATFPGIQEPVFSITSIAILKAELINTRFRVTLRVNNPNPFQVDLSAFSYELFGNGRLWANGVEKNAFSVPGKTTVEGNMFLLMNFIGMERNLLNQIVNLVDVNYRFAGDALVDTGLEYLPNFRTDFDLTGYSRVLER